RNQTKAWGLDPANAYALFAGNSAAHHAIVTKTHQQVMHKKVTDIGEVADLFLLSMIEFERGRAERKYLRPLNLDLKTLVAKQNPMNVGFVSGLVEKVFQESAGVRAIVAGFDEGGPHIYHIDPQRQVTCDDDAGYCAIGTGRKLFERQLFLAGYDRFWSAHEA